MREALSLIPVHCSEIIERFNSRRFLRVQYIMVEKVLFQPGDRGFGVVLKRKRRGRPRVCDIASNQKLVHMLQDKIKFLNDHKNTIIWRSILFY
jgi:hypothetical protein